MLNSNKEDIVIVIDDQNDKNKSTLKQNGRCGIDVFSKILIILSGLCVCMMGLLLHSSISTMSGRTLAMDPHHPLHPLGSWAEQVKNAREKGKKLDAANVVKEKQKEEQMKKQAEIRQRKFEKKWPGLTARLADWSDVARSQGQRPPVEDSPPYLASDGESDGGSESSYLTPYLASDDSGDDSDDVPVAEIAKDNLPGLTKDIVNVEEQIGEYSHRNDLACQEEIERLETEERVSIEKESVPGLTKVNPIKFKESMKTSFKDYLNKWLDVWVDGKRLKCRVDAVSMKRKRTDREGDKPRCQLTCQDGKDKFEKNVWVDALW